MTNSDKRMSKLVKDLDFTTTGEYYDYIIDSYTNGQRPQVKNLFKSMPKEYRKKYVQFLIDEGETQILQFLIDNVIFE